MNLKVKYAILKGLTIVLIILSMYLFLVSDDLEDCLHYLTIYFALALVLFVLCLIESFER